MTMPNFLVIGAAKAGTSALYWYLRQHPQIYMSPEKEPRFFSWVGETWDPTNPALEKTINTLEKYTALFADVKGEAAIGEASPSYLFNERAPGNIKTYVPDAKLIVVLRNPAERAFSHFMHFIKVGYEPNYHFEEVIQDIEGLRIGNWIPRKDYIGFGYYGQQLKRYYDLFDPAQIKVYLHEDLKTDTAGTMVDLYRFLGVDDSFVADVAVRHNVSGIPKSRLLQDILTGKSWLRKLVKPAKAFIPKAQRDRLKARVDGMNLDKPKLTAPARRYLMDLYGEDIVELQALLGRDLSSWLNAGEHSGASVSESEA